MLLDANLNILDDESAGDTVDSHLGTILDFGLKGDAYAHNARVRITCTETVTSGGAATVAFDFLTSANADASSPVVTQLVAATGKADITIGTVLYDGPLPNGLLRYNTVRQTNATAALTAGKFTIDICGVTDRAAQNS